MKLVTIFIVCAIDTLLNLVKTKMDQVIELTLGDPKIIHAKQNQEKILYWEDIRCSNESCRWLGRTTVFTLSIIYCL